MNEQALLSKQIGKVTGAWLIQSGLVSEIERLHPVPEFYSEHMISLDPFLGWCQVVSGEKNLFNDQGDLTELHEALYDGADLVRMLLSGNIYPSMGPFYSRECIHLYRNGLITCIYPIKCYMSIVMESFESPDCNFSVGSIEWWLNAHEEFLTL
ncbi:hypothetical protein C0431_15585 [bacterium]|nr:hypothetical protein [bacterium]